MRVTFSSTVLRGFPVDVEALIEHEDLNDYAQVGAYHSGRHTVTGIEIFKRGQHKKLPFIERQMTDDDWTDLCQEALDAAVEDG